MIVVSNADPIIALSRIHHLDVLHSLFGIVHIPSVVKREIDNCCSTMAGYSQIFTSNWIHVVDVGDELAAQFLMNRLDAGESYSIVLALQMRADILLIDEALGRRVAESKSLKKTGTIGALVLAKKAGLIPAVTPVLNQLRDDGFRMTEALYQTAKTLVGE